VTKRSSQIDSIVPATTITYSKYKVKGREEGGKKDQRGYK
jgi:hypothetical protein